MTPPVLAIVGPTCTGKTSLAVRLAKRLGPAELLSADSRQLRRGLHVGTCAPTATELDGVRCHLLELADPGAPFSVADWLDAAGDALLALERRDVAAIVVGGTGLYVTALVDGFDFGGAPPDPERRATRADLAATPQGLAQLAGELEERDPVGSAALDMRNPRRVLRALEILDARRGSLVDARRADPRPAVLVGLDVDDDTHTRWLRARVFGMFDSGALIEEVDQALRRGVSVEALAASGIGYAEAIDVIHGRRDLEAAAVATLRRTARYAKAQRTYFRRDPRIHWLRPDVVTPKELLTAALRLAREGGAAPGVGGADRGRAAPQAASAS